MTDQTPDDRQTGEIFSLSKAFSPETISRMKKLMEEKDLSIQELADKAGITQERAETFFTDSLKATIGDFLSICEALDISPNQANGDKTIVIG